MNSASNNLPTIGFQLAFVPDSNAVVESSRGLLQHDMDIDDDSQPETPSLEPESGLTSAGSAEQQLFDRQCAILKTFTDSVPYECESVDEMNDKLKGIVEKIVMCATVGDWVSMSHANNGLHWYVVLTISQFVRMTIVF